MFQAAHYSESEMLRDGRRLEIRALAPADQPALLAAVNRGSAQALYRRFFGAKRHFSEKEIAFFMNPDFVDHVALVAIAEERGLATIVGGGRYVMVQPGTAELAFFVLDEYQGQGLGAALMRHLTTLARRAGLKELTAEVLPDNGPMLGLFNKCGLHLHTRRDASAVHVSLALS